MYGAFLGAFSKNVFKKYINYNLLIDICESSSGTTFLFEYVHPWPLSVVR
jgi:hypothetical protein